MGRVLARGWCAMNCVNVALRDFVFLSGIFLCVLGVACIVISIVRTRAARLGDALLEACAYDEQSVAKALANIRRDNDLLDAALRHGLESPEYRQRVAEFYDEDTYP